MTEQAILPGLWPIPGDGVLARQGDLVLLIHPAGGAFTDRLLSLLTEVARTGGDGLRFTGLVSAEFDNDALAADAASAQPGPAVVAFGPAGLGTAIAVYGAGWAEVTTGYGAQRLTTGQPYGRLRSVLPSPATAISAGVQATADGGETDPYMRLADGMVRAVGLVFAPAGAGQDPGGLPQAAAGLGQHVAPGLAGYAAPGLADYAAPGSSAADVGQGAPAVGGAAIPMPPASELASPHPASPATPEPASASVPGPATSEPFPGPATSEPFPGPVEDHAPEAGYLATRLEPAVAPPVSDPYLPDSYPPSSERPLPGALSGGPDSLVPGLPGDEVPGHGAQYPGAEAQGIQHPGPSDLPTELPSSIPPAIVEGVYCANGHFNDPQARDCAVCGIGLSPSASWQQGMRPPLGALILDDGSMCQLDADCIIGREPTLDSAVAEGRARPLRVTDASGVVSRMHARVELDGWQAFITDLHSANGTQILRPGERHPTSLEPGVRVPLPGGTQIRLGGEFGLEYDAHRHV